MATSPKSNGKQGSDPASRLMALFTGNTRSSGRYDLKRDRAFTEAAPALLEDFIAHIQGVIGVGVVPIQDDDTCQFAVLDVDNHDSDEDIPLHPFAEKIAVLKLPLVACRSKSGGIHAYLFLDKPVSCQRVRVMMTQFAIQLGVAGCEVFPKQGKLSTTNEGKKQQGNWINLPYFDADKTMRYAVIGDKRLSLLEFLDYVEKNRVGEASLKAQALSEHPDAPPCVQRMYANGVAQGHRNEGLYAVGVYQRKRNPDDYKAKTFEANQTIFSRALGRAEAERTINSAGKADYGYRCNEEPCRSLCDRGVCLTRKYGITPVDAERIDTVDALPEFTDLTKFESDPVKWEFRVGGVKITNISTDELLDWRAIRSLIAARLTKGVPLIKTPEWERILFPMMKEARIIETPDDASIAGLMRERLREFAGKTNLLNKGQDKEERKALLRGLPVVQEIDGTRCVVFRQQDFVNYLKRTKSEEMKGVNLWMAVKELGVRHGRIRIGTTDNINVWHLPVSAVMGNDAEKPEYTSEL